MLNFQCPNFLPKPLSEEEREAKRLRDCKLYKQDPNCQQCKDKVNHPCGIGYVGFFEVPPSYDEIKQKLAESEDRMKRYLECHCPNCGHYAWDADATFCILCRIDEERQELKKRVEHLSLKLHHMRLQLQQEYERAESAEEDCDTLALLATKGIELLSAGPHLTLEEVQEKYDLTGETDE